MRKANVVRASLVGLALLGATTDARADSDATTAENDFQEGRRLMEAKRYTEACPKFLSSYKAQSAGGTLLNLADCYEKAGQLASAVARFRESITVAQYSGRADREKTARERIEKLEPRLIRLTIVAPKDVEVRLDKEVVDPSMIKSPIPVDPGKHTIEGSAKGKRSFSTTIEVSERAKSPSVEIPPLEDDRAATPSPATKPTTTPSSSAETATVVLPPEEPKSTWSGQKTLGVVLIGGGLVAAGVGTFFGLATRSKWNEATGHCTVELECDEDGVTLAADAKSAGNLSTIAFVAAGGLVAGGVVLFLTAPSHKSSASARNVVVGLGAGRLVLGGSF